jgi:hypothetical protein
MAWPAAISDEATLEEVMTRPDEALCEDLAAVPGDLLVLGAAGKMGPTLCRLARRADPSRRVIAVARWSEPGLRERMGSWGIECLSADLTDRAALAALPDAPNVIFMAARKFGSTGNEALTWAMNVLLPAMVAERYAASRIVFFSTGNVLPMVPVNGPMPDETTTPAPVGAGTRVPACRRGARHALLRHPAELRHRPAVRGAARRRDEGAERHAGALGDGARQRDLAGRRQCLDAARAAPRRCRLPHPERDGA